MYNIGLLNLGGWEIVLILALVLILFGAKRLPKVAKGLGESVREFRKIGRDNSDVTSSENNTPFEQPPPAPRNGTNKQSIN